MQKSKIFALALTAVMALSPSVGLAQEVSVAPAAPVFSKTMPWWIIICPADIVAAGVVKNWRRKKELTAPEAWTCGFLYWWNEAIGKYGR
jgi:predicted cobalt transporter CbtA